MSLVVEQTDGPTQQRDLGYPFELVDGSGELPREQVVFFVRHAMSRWNRDQADRAWMSMFRENDHGLAEEGRHQAEDLRSLIKGAYAELQADRLHGYWLPRFLQPDAVYTSPFTRTIETTVIGLRDILPQDTLVVMREAREHKNCCGADSTGVATGDGIPVRVEEDLRNIYEDHYSKRAEIAVADFKTVRLDTSDVQDEWWGPYFGDHQQDLDQRLNEFVERLRRTRGSTTTGGGSSIVVGHSVFFRNVFRKFLSEPPKGGFAELNAASLRQHVLPYCGVVGARFTWDAGGAAHISEAVPILATSLTPADMSAEIFAERRCAIGICCSRQGQGGASAGAKSVDGADVCTIA